MSACCKHTQAESPEESKYSLSVPHDRLRRQDLKQNEVPAHCRGYRLGADNSEMKREYSGVFAGMRNSACVPVCVNPRTEIKALAINNNKASVQ